MNFLDFNLRLWEYNHAATIHDRVTHIVDCFPLTVSRPGNSILRKLFRSGKYKDFVVKGELVTSLCGFPIDYTGLHIGVRHDSRIWMENGTRRAKLYAWEYGLGDLAYIGCPKLLTGFKKPPGGALTASEDEWTRVLGFDRARVEHLIANTVTPRAALTTRWRGSHALHAAIVHIVAHMTGLQERMKGPKYDVYGPWPPCPANVARAFP